MHKKCIVVTGGAGFVGSHLCAELVKSGNYVICIDDLSTGSIDNIRPLLESDDFKFVNHDVREYIEVYNVDQIYNLACPASPVHYQADPLKTLYTNINGCTNMANLAKKTGARLLQASTSEVYGDPLVHPQPESYTGNVNHTGIRGCYDEGKRCAETILFEYHRVHNVDIRIARIFNTFGPGMQIDDGRVMSNFIVQALKNDDITIYGDGSQTRSFCYVDDLVRGLIMLMNVDSPSSRIVNLGNPVEINMLQLANIVLSITESDSKIVQVPLPQDDPTKRLPDITVAKSMGWEPTVNVLEGINKTIEYFRCII